MWTGCRSVQLSEGGHHQPAQPGRPTPSLWPLPSLPTLPARITTPATCNQPAQPCRFCALKLAEGAIGDVNDLPEGYTTNPAVHPLRVVAIDGIASSSSSSFSSFPAPPLSPLPGTPPPAAAASASGGGGDGVGGIGSGSAAALPPPHALSSPSGRVKFVDKDEHVYFWFPLLAGLSELTFDPRCGEVWTITCVGVTASLPQISTLVFTHPPAQARDPQQCPRSAL